MPRGPKGEKRPADVIQRRTRLADRHGEAEEEIEAKPETERAAAELGARAGESIAGSSKLRHNRRSAG